MGEKSIGAATLRTSFALRRNGFLPRADEWTIGRTSTLSRPQILPRRSGAAALPDRSETFFSPRLALLHKLTNNISLTASGYRAFRAPTLNELYRGFRAGNVFTEFNPNLRAERLTGAEGGAIVTGLNQRVMLRSTFFWNQITRPVANVTLTTTPALITRQRQNLGSTRSQGLELEASARLSNSLSISGGYEYTDATVTSFTIDPALAGLNPSLVGLDVPQIPRHQFTFQTAYTQAVHFTGGAGAFRWKPVRRRSEHTTAAAVFRAGRHGVTQPAAWRWNCLSPWRT